MPSPFEVLLQLMPPKTLKSGQNYFPDSSDEKTETPKGLKEWSAIWGHFAMNLAHVSISLGMILVII